VSAPMQAAQLARFLTLKRCCFCRCLS